MLSAPPSVFLAPAGAEGYIVASSLRGVIAQRLVRKVCRNCSRPVFAGGSELIWLKSVMGEEAEKQQFQLGEGCSHCHNTGYRGRVGIFEILEMMSFSPTLLEKTTLPFSAAR